MDAKRKNRINGELQKQVYNAIKKYVGDNYDGVLISVTRTDVTSDLAECKVYLSIFTLNKNYNANDILNAIKNSSKEIREFVAHNVNLRIMPKLIFLLDKGEENAIKVGDILNQIKKTDGE